MMKYSSIFIFLLFVLGLVSCKNEIGDGTEGNLKLGFAPIEVGKYWVYQNDSIIYDMVGTVIDTASSFSKEIIAEKYLDQSGDSIYRIERFYKKTMQDDWVLNDIWTCQKTKSQYIRTEENLKFLKLIFPTDIGLSWDGNQFFDENVETTIAGDPITPYRYWDYKIEEADTLVFAGISYPEVIKVDHILSDDPYEYRESYEHYAMDVGLVQRRMIVLDAQCSPNCIGTTWGRMGREWLYHRSITYRI